MPKDAKIGMIVGMLVVILFTVIFFHKERKGAEKSESRTAAEKKQAAITSGQENSSWLP